MAEVSTCTIKHLSVHPTLEWMLLTFVCNVPQDLEVEAEAEHQQEVGSQPRAWGMVATHVHTHRGFHIL